MTKFIPQKIVIDAVLFYSPVPTNVVKPSKLDDFFKELLEEQNNKS